MRDAAVTAPACRSRRTAAPAPLRRTNGAAVGSVPARAVRSVVALRDLAGDGDPESVAAEAESRARAQACVDGLQQGLRALQGKLLGVLRARELVLAPSASDIHERAANEREVSIRFALGCGCASCRAYDASDKMGWLGELPLDTLFKRWSRKLLGADASGAENTVDASEVGVCAARDAMHAGFARTARDNASARRAARSARRDGSPESKEEFVARLFEHMNFLVRASVADVLAADEIFADSLAGVRALLEAAAGRSPAERDSATVLALLAPLWRETFCQWPEDMRVDALADELLAMYPTDFGWHDVFEGYSFATILGPRSAEGMYPLKKLCMYLLLCRGVSLFRAAPLFGWSMSRSVAACIARTGSMYDAVIDAVSPYARDRDAIAAALTSADSDPTETESDFLAVVCKRRYARRYPLLGAYYGGSLERHGAHAARFWQVHLSQAARWLINFGAGLDAASKSIIVQWATESLRAELTEFEAAGTPRPARPLVFWRTLSARTAYEKALAAWPGHGWNATIHDASGSWSFRELTSAAALKEAGRAMKNCLADYFGRCRGGRAVIVSVHRDTQLIAAVEVDPADGTVREALGPANRRLAPDEERMVHWWAHQCVKQVEARAGRDACWLRIPTEHPADVWWLPITHSLRARVISSHVNGVCILVLKQVRPDASEEVLVRTALRQTVPAAFDEALDWLANLYTGIDPVNDLVARYLREIRGVPALTLDPSA